MTQGVIKMMLFAGIVIVCAILLVGTSSGQSDPKREADYKQYLLAANNQRPTAMITTPIQSMFTREAVMICGWADDRDHGKIHGRWSVNPRSHGQMSPTALSGRVPLETCVTFTAKKTGWVKVVLTDWDSFMAKGRDSMRFWIGKPPPHRP